MQGMWEVGLAEIFIPSYSFNIKPPDIFSHHLHKGDYLFAEGSLREETFKIPYPRRSVQAQRLRENVQQKGEDDAGPVKVKSRMRYDEYSNRIIFMVGTVRWLKLTT